MDGQWRKTEPLRPNDLDPRGLRGYSLTALIREDSDRGLDRIAEQPARRAPG